MLRTKTLLILLLAGGLTAVLLSSGFSFSVGASAAPPAIVVDPQPLITLPAERDASITLTGRGLDGGLQGWIVPETLSRQAIISTLPTYNRLRELEIRGRFAYLLTTQGGVLQVDLDNPYDPTVVNAITTSGQALHLKVADNDLVLVPAGTSGLHLVELGARQPARHLATIPEAAPALDVAIHDGTAFVARGEGGVSIYDISSPAHPQQLGQIAFGGRALWLKSWDHYLAVSLDKGETGLAILDVSIPSRPQRVAHISLDGAACAAFTINGHQALATTNGTDLSNGGLLYTIDLSLPDSPRVTSITSFNGRASDVTWEGDLALLSLGTNGLAVVDMSQPLRPRSLTTYAISGSIFSADQRGGVAWLSDTGGDLIALDLRREREKTSAQTIDDVNPEFEPMIRDGLMIVADKTREVRIYDVSSPETPPLFLASRKMPGMIRYLMLHDRILYVSCLIVKNDVYSGELTVLDLKVPGNPRIISQTPYSKVPWPVGCEGDTLVLLIPESKSMVKMDSCLLSLIDISTPAKPRQISTTRLASFPVGATLEAGRLYLMQIDGLFRSFDVRSAAQPTIVGEIRMPWLHESTWRCGQVRIIPWQDDLILVSSPLAGIKMINLDDPENPLLLGTIETDGSVFSLAREGDLLLVSRRGKGLLAISLELPWQPQAIGTWSMPGYAQELVTSQGSLWYTLYNGRGIYYTPLPQPLSIKAARNGSNATLRLPSGLQDGDYSLWLKNAEGALELPAQLRIVRQGQKKPLG